MRAPAAVGCVQYDGLLVVRVAEVGREVRLQVLVLARLRLPTDARHVDAGALRRTTKIQYGYVQYGSG